MADEQKPWVVEVGPREIYDVLMTVKHNQDGLIKDVKALQKGQEEDERDRAAIAGELAKNKADVDKLKIKVYGVLVGLAVSLGGLLRSVFPVGL